MAQSSAAKGSAASGPAASYGNIPHIANKWHAAMSVLKDSMAVKKMAIDMAKTQAETDLTKNKTKAMDPIAVALGKLGQTLEKALGSRDTGYSNVDGAIKALKIRNEPGMELTDKAQKDLQKALRAKKERKAKEKFKGKQYHRGGWH